MRVERVIFRSLDEKEVPGFCIGSGNKAALLIHGFSSSKDEILGLAFKVAEKNYATFAIDLRGHGENENVFDENVIADVEGTIRELRKSYNKILTIGHSLGGLLSLKSSSDFAIAISPPLMPIILPEVEFMLSVNSCKVFGNYRVLMNILKTYNPPERRKDALILYGSGESEGIKISIKRWSEGRDVRIVEISEKQAIMPEVDVEAEKLKTYIPRFISHLSIIHSKKLLDFL